MSSSWRRILLNYDSNYEFVDDNLNIYARLQHKLSDDDATSSLKNVFYTLQANYSKVGSYYKIQGTEIITLHMVMLESLFLK